MKFSNISGLLALVAVLTFLGACSPAPLSESQLKSYLEARQSYEKGDFAGSGKVLDQLLSERGDFYQARFLKGKVLFFQKRLPDARAEFEKLSKDHPEFTMASSWLAQIDFQENQPDKALDRLKNLLSYDPLDYRLLYLTGLAYLQKKDPKNAIDFFRQSTLAEEELSKPHLELGRLYFQLGNFQAALTELQRAQVLLLPNSPLEPVLRDLIAQVESEMKKPAGAKP